MFGFTGCGRLRSDMGGNFERLSDFHAGFDSVIDVRSPAEFAIDHVPGAINLPVLSNDERAEVGTLYVQTSPFEARKIGGALVMKNIAQHLSGVLSDKPRGWKPLVYCWRGGQRSGAMTWALAQVGWKSEQLKGGYKTYRALVKDALYDREMTRPVVLLDGNTGTAKTELLQILAARGVNVLDLEALANHRGSVFGGMAAPQPSQRMFERDILSALEAMAGGGGEQQGGGSFAAARLVVCDAGRAAHSHCRHAGGAGGVFGAGLSRYSGGCGKARANAGAARADDRA